MLKFMWTKGALKDFEEGRNTKRLRAHTISNVTEGALDALLRQIRPGTPFVLLDTDTMKVVRRGGA